MLGNLTRMEERIVFDAAAPDNSNTNQQAPANPVTEPVADSPVAQEQATANADPSAPASTDDAAPHENSAHRLLLVSDSVQNYQQLVEAAGSGVTVLTYHDSHTSLQDILNNLTAQYGGTKFDSIAIAAHSAAGGEIQLASGAVVNADTLSTVSGQQEFFSALGSYLGEGGRLDLLSCFTAAGETGARLLQQLQTLTGHAVAASDDLSGNPEAGADWYLESGGVDAGALYFNQSALAGYSGYLTSMADETVTLPFAAGGEANSTPNFGGAMDYDADSGILVVGAKLYETSADSTQDRGAVYVYRWDSANERLQYLTMLQASNTTVQYFGMSVAVDSVGTGGNYRVSIAAGASDGVYVYDINLLNGVWNNVVTPEVKLTATGQGAGFGKSIDLCNGTLVVGDSEYNSNAGRVVVYQSALGGDGTLWEAGETDLACLLARDGMFTDDWLFGNQVAVTDVDADGMADRIVALADGAEAANPGVYIFNFYGVNVAYPLIYTDQALHALLPISDPHVAFITASFTTPGINRLVLDKDFLVFTSDNYVKPYHCEAGSWTSYYASMFDLSGVGVITGLALNANGDLAVGANASGDYKVRTYDNFVVGTGWTVGAKDVRGFGVTGDGFGSALASGGSGRFFAGAPSAVSSLPQSVFTFEDGGTVWGADNGTTYAHAELVTVVPGVNQNGWGFASNIAMDGNVAVVTTNYVAGYAYGRHVYVYERIDNQWVWQAELLPQTAASGAGLSNFAGPGVDVSGNTIIVAGGNGAVYVYEKGLYTHWRTMSETAILWAGGISGGDFTFGGSASHSIAISGDMIVVGQAGAMNSYTDEGAIYVFARTGGLWGYDARLGADGIVSGDDVHDIDGDGTSDTVTDQKFRRSATVFYGGGASYRLGTSVDIEASGLSSGTIVAGATGYNSGAGAVRVFTNAGSWVPQATLTFNASAHGAYTPSAGLGNRVSLDFDTIVAAASGYDRSMSLMDAGALIVFDSSLQGGSWVNGEGNYECTLFASNGISNSQLGQAGLCIEGNTIAALGSVSGVYSTYYWTNLNGAWGTGTTLARSETGVLVGGETQSASGGLEVWGSHVYAGNPSASLHGGASGAFYGFTLATTVTPGQTFVVNTLKDGVDAYDNLTSLREALLNAHDGDLVTFDNALAGQTILIGDTDGNGVVDDPTPEALQLANSVTIDGDLNNDGFFDITLDGGMIWSDDNANGILDYSEAQMSFGGAEILALVSADAQTVSIYGVRFQNGAERSAGLGGAICNNGATLMLANSILRNNYATDSGGAVYSGVGTLSGLAGALAVNHTSLSGNVSGNDGGAIYSFGVGMSLANCSFTDNYAQGDGGAVYSSQYNQTFLAEQVSFAGNSAGNFGGGLYYAGGNATLVNVQFSGNSAAHGGGGAYIGDCISFAYNHGAVLDNTVADGNGAGLDFTASVATTSVQLSKLIISGNQITGLQTAGGGAGLAFVVESAGGIRAQLECLSVNNNEAAATGAGSASGGGLYNQGAAIFLVNSNLSGNAAEAGGGIYNAYSSSALAQGKLQIVNATIARNVATAGGEAGGIAADAGVTGILLNSIIAGNTGADGGSADAAGVAWDYVWCWLGTESSGRAANGTNGNVIDNSAAALALLGPVAGALPVVTLTGVSSATKGTQVYAHDANGDHRFDTATDYIYYFNGSTYVKLLTGEAVVALESERLVADANGEARAADSSARGADQYPITSTPAATSPTPIALNPVIYMPPVPQATTMMGGTSGLSIPGGMLADLANSLSSTFLSGPLPLLSSSAGGFLGGDGGAFGLALGDGGEAGGEGAPQGQPGPGEGPGAGQGEGAPQGQGEGAPQGQGEGAPQGQPQGQGGEAPGQGQGQGQGQQPQGAQAQSGQGTAGAAGAGGQAMRFAPDVYGRPSVGADFVTETVVGSSFSAFRDLAVNGGSTLSGLGENAATQAVVLGVLSLNSDTAIGSSTNLISQLISGQVRGVLFLSTADGPAAGEAQTGNAQALADLLRESQQSLLRARGDALQANDLLRIISLNIRDFSDRIAENSFAAGLKKVAAANERLTVEYEVLNGLMTLVKDGRDKGNLPSAEDVAKLLPALRQEALHKARLIAENTDRASEDALALLTKRMQDSVGKDRDVLKGQVAKVLTAWRAQMGLSAPVTIENASEAVALFAHAVPQSVSIFSAAPLL